MTGADPLRGLSEREALDRLARDGPNQTPEFKPNLLVLFLKKFWGTTAWMLEFTIVIALLRHRSLDAGVIGALLVFNGVLGFFQEQRASRSVEALKNRLQVMVRVLRDGTWKKIPAAGLVVGDILRLRSGDFVPADGKLLSGDLEADLSTVTGETEPKAFHTGTMVLSGSVVRRGEANVLVLLTGANTFFGKTTQLVETARPKLHFEEVMGRVVRWLLFIVVSLLAVATTLWVLRGGSLLDILPLLLILLVSAIPVALPAMFTVTLALGSSELVKKGVLVTRLSASEDAARMDVLCSDKTGTLTANRLTLAQVKPAAGYSEEDVVFYGFLCSEAANQDPIDLAFLRKAAEMGVDRRPWKRESFTPFDPSTRRTEALVEWEGSVFRTYKGSLDSLFGLCVSCGEVEKDHLRSWAGEFAQKGFRTLAVAQEEGGEVRLVGLAVLYDPPRPDSKQVLRELARLGVRVKMLTGDALPIARETSKELGLGGNILNLHGGGGGASLDLGGADGFAEIYPEDKYRIVKGLQDGGHVVGMTGDGVNDAPALRQAEVGAAVENATDVAKGAASVVLTREGLSALPDLIRTGRSIHQRVETWILNKIVKTFQTVVFVVVAFVVTGQFIVSTFDMVLLLFLVDFVTLSLATDRAKGSPKPTTWNIDHLVKGGFPLGVVSVLEALGLLGLSWDRFHLGQDIQALHTFSFGVLFYFGMFTVLAVRERGPFWTSRPSGPLLAAILADMAITAVLMTIGMPGLSPLPWTAVLFIVAYGLVFGLFLNDFLKVSLLAQRERGDGPAPVLQGEK